MLVFPPLTQGSVGFSSIHSPYDPTGVQFGQNNALPITSLGLVATISTGASLFYSVQVTADPVPSVNGNWNNHDVLVNQTASLSSNILYGVSGVRLSVTQWTSGSVTLGIVQWP